MDVGSILRDDIHRKRKQALSEKLEKSGFAGISKLLSAKKYDYLCVK